MKNAYVISVFIILCAVCNCASATQMQFEGSSINTGLSSDSDGSTHTIFEIDDVFYTVVGGSSNTWSGYRWTGSTWTVDSSIISGLPTDIGFSVSPNHFEISGSHYILVGLRDGTWKCYEWNGSSWVVATPDYSTGLSDVGSYAKGVVFETGGSIYCVAGSEDGAWDGFKWNGVSFATDAGIISGLDDVGFNSAPTSFELDGELYLISGSYVGPFSAWHWTGSVWEDYDMLEENLPLYSSSYGMAQSIASVGYYDGKYYLVASDAGYAATYSGFVLLHDNPPSLVSPTNGSVVNVQFPPLYVDTDFVWEDVGTTYNIVIGTDSVFSNVLYDSETDSNSAVVSLVGDDYYWKVRSYYTPASVYGNWSDVYHLELVSVSSTVGSGVEGVVYSAGSLETRTPLQNAIVTIQNETYSSSVIVGSDGYYRFHLSNGTYYVRAQLDNYVTTDAYPVNVTGEFEIFNIPMRKADTYFAPHYVKFKVVHDSNWLDVVPYTQPVAGATITIYEGSSTSAYATQLTGSDGVCGFSLSEHVRYRIVVAYGAITQTEYITPIEGSYVIEIEGEDGAGLLPESQFYEVCNITIEKTQMNSSVAKIDIVYTDNEDSTDSVYFEIGQTLNNGTFVATDTSAVYTGNTTCSLYVDNYKGQSYTVIAHVVHDSFGTITKYFTVTFSGSNLPFTGKAMGYLGVVLLFVVFAMWGKQDVAQGAILSVGLGWFLWYLDIFECFGTALNTLMGAGLLLGTLLAIMNLINKKRDEGGI